MQRTIDAILHKAVEEGHAPNLVAVVSDADGILYSGGVGALRSDSEEVVTAETEYRLASMTKMITTVGALQLIEAGAVGLDQPVEELVPEFGSLQILERMEGDSPLFSQPRTKATVRHLLTHTSGLGYWFWNENLLAWEKATGTPNVLAGDGRAFTAPLSAEPGSRFEYGMSTDYLGKVIERASGMSLPDYLRERVTDPLGMGNTTFTPNEEQRAHLVPVYVPDGNGGWVETPIDWPTTPDWWAGGHALYSTPMDYSRFQRMLLRGGELNGTRVLSEQKVREAFSSQIGDLSIPEVVSTVDPASSDDFHFGADKTWGWGLLLNKEQEPGMRAPYSGAWAGLANTHFWIDRTSGISGSIYTQFLPFAAPGLMRVYEDFERAVYATL